MLPIGVLMITEPMDEIEPIPNCTLIAPLVLVSMDILGLYF